MLMKLLMHEMSDAEELGIMSHKRWFAWQQLLQWWQQLGPVWVPRPQRRPCCPPSRCLLPEPSFMPTYVDMDESQVQQWVKQPWARQPFKVPMVLPTHPPPTTRAYRLPDAAPTHWMGLFPGVSVRCCPPQRSSPRWPRARLFAICCYL